MPIDDMPSTVNTTAEIYHELCINKIYPHNDMQLMDECYICE